MMTIKMMVIRKNSLFYKTVNGAHVGDILMSLIETCRHAKVNAYEYLLALLKNIPVMRKNPSAWLPSMDAEPDRTGCPDS
ncbi:MAG: transposase domain-containing protein [Spirochaetales bacterium]|nr:transposase domain-containing protein [Spirochaetales bacterium]